MSFLQLCHTLSPVAEGTTAGNDTPDSSKHQDQPQSQQVQQLHYNHSSLTYLLYLELFGQVPLPTSNFPTSNITSKFDKFYLKCI